MRALSGLAFSLAAVGAVGAVGALAAVVATACNDVQTHVYSAQLYEQSSDCLDDYAAIDVVTGGSGSARCAPVCLVGSGAYYVSTMCPPYPAALTASDPDAAPDPLCTAALAAADAGKSCSAPPDAAGEAGDDGGDAAGDDGGDASGDDGGDASGDDGGDASGDDGGDASGDDGGDAGGGGDAAGDR
jgi:hypothetical protein